MNFNKKILIVLTIFITFLTYTGCSIARSDTNKNYSSISELINVRNEAMQERDIKKYMSTVDRGNREFYAEQLHWFNDYIQNSIRDYSYVIKDIENIDKNRAIVTIKQYYTLGEKSYKTTFNEIYIKKEDGWKDSDLDLDSTETKHFLIKYPEGYGRVAKKIGSDAERAYVDLKGSLGNVPKDKTVIKIYKDKELLRQSVKLSFTWDMGGWYEYPESIKMLFESKFFYRSTLRTIEHELTHKMTIEESNNNLPYWLSEGLACYYSNTSLMPPKNNPYGSIFKLEEVNLEKLTDQGLISAYYANSYELVKFIASSYGQKKLLTMIREFGKYPYSEGTGIDVDKSGQEKFRRVVIKTLGIDIDELNNGWIDWSKSRLKN